MIDRWRAVYAERCTYGSEGSYPGNLPLKCGKALGSYLLKILIVVVIGAAILLILNAAVPNLFQDLIDKISGELTGVDVLP